MGRGGALGGEGALAGAGAGAGASFFTLAFEAGFLGMVPCNWARLRRWTWGEVGARLDWECLFDGLGEYVPCACRPAGAGA